MDRIGSDEARHAAQDGSVWHSLRGSASNAQLLDHAFEDPRLQMQGLAPFVLLGLDDLLPQVGHVDLECTASSIAFRVAAIKYPLPSFCAGVRPLTVGPGCPSRATRASHATHPSASFCVQFYD